MSEHIDGTSISFADIGWKLLHRHPKRDDISTIKNMRKSQQQAFIKCSDSKHIILNGPTACGKSLMGCQLIGNELRKTDYMKAIIAVPQTIIADGFLTNYTLNYVDEFGKNLKDGDSEIIIEPINWCVGHDLVNGVCDEESNANQIIEVLKSGSKKCLADRIIVCTHASLVKAFTLNPKAFKDVRIFIDEGHHVMISDGSDLIDDTSIEMFSNMMGKLVTYAVTHVKQNIRITLSTATFFRGDRLSIIPEKHKDKFTHFWYPMHDFLADCDYLKQFYYSFLMYKHDWEETINKLFEGELKKTAIYIPNVGNRYYSYGTKEKDLEHLYRGIAGVEKYEKIEHESGLTQIKRGDRWINIINLVDDSDVNLRNKRKRFISKSHTASDGKDIDVIIALNMFREGANWKWAERGVIIGTKGSLTDLTQITGRFLRDAPLKERVGIIQVLPFSVENMDAGVFKTNLDEYLKSIIGAMVIEDIISPINLKIKVDGGFGLGDSTPFSKDALVDELFILMAGDGVKYEKISKDMITEVADAYRTGVISSTVSGVKRDEAIKTVIKSVLSDYKIDKTYHNSIASFTLGKWKRKSLKIIKGVDVSNLDFETISAYEIDPLLFIPAVTSIACDITNLGEFSKKYNKAKYKTWDDWVKFIIDNKIIDYIKDSWKKKTDKEFSKYYSKWATGNVKSWKGIDLPVRPDDIPKNPKSVYDTYGVYFKEKA